jgi:hypothetical protein
LVEIGLAFGAKIDWNGCGLNKSNKQQENQLKVSEIESRLV